MLADRWSWLVLLEVARGHTRFDMLVAQLGISRKVLAERLTGLRGAGVLTREPYQLNPVRYDYRLTRAGTGLLPVIVDLQDWGDRWVLGDGLVTAGATVADRQRVLSLVGHELPDITLPTTSGSGVLGPGVLLVYAGSSGSMALPEGWADIEGTGNGSAALLALTERCDDFQAPIWGVSTERPEVQQHCAEAASIGFPLLSDCELTLAASLRLPTLRFGGKVWLRPMILVVGKDRAIRAVRYPILDPDQAVQWALDAAVCPS